jgi:MerR family redox-sensitive transcriptional activator SoxR
MAHLSIGEVARRASLRTSAIRYYESVGLLPEPERVGGHRRYDEDVLQSLHLIQMAQQMGFTIVEIQALLHGFPPETAPQERWKAFARRKLEEADAVIRQAAERKERLEQILNCRCASLEECASTSSSTP